MGASRGDKAGVGPAAGGRRENLNSPQARGQGRTLRGHDLAQGAPPSPLRLTLLARPRPQEHLLPPASFTATCGHHPRPRSPGRQWHWFLSALRASSRKISPRVHRQGVRACSVRQNCVSSGK